LIHISACPAPVQQHCLHSACSGKTMLRKSLARGDDCIRTSIQRVDRYLRSQGHPVIGVVLTEHTFVPTARIARARFPGYPGSWGRRGGCRCSFTIPRERCAPPNGVSSSAPLSSALDPSRNPSVQGRGCLLCAATGRTAGPPTATRTTRVDCVREQRGQGGQHLSRPRA
jgi:hypothetical protein